MQPAMTDQNEGSCCSSHAPHHSAPAPSPPPTSSPTTYTCPMHPEVVRDGPGACPICGMALEPMTASLDDAPNTELLDMQRRFVISIAFSIPLLLLGMADMFGGALHELTTKP